MSGITRVGQPQDLVEAFIADRASLLAIARRVVRSGSDAEDIVQDVAMKLCELPSERAVLCPIRYLRSMVRNQAIDRLRRAAQAACEPAPSLDTVASDAQGPEEQIESREALRAVAVALAALPERTRLAFVAHRLAGQPQNVIATSLGVSPTLVNFMVRDATLACRRAFNAAGALPPLQDSRPVAKPARGNAPRGTATAPTQRLRDAS